jgi:3-phosphoshikimate 1-carboxyvinyltransferase
LIRTIVPGSQISGEIFAPPSKAQTHRALVAGLLSDGTTTITNPLSCDDTQATASAITTLGAKLNQSRGKWVVESDGVPKSTPNAIDCRESGVTLRFIIPVASLTGAEIVLKAREALMRRPLGPLINAMHQLNIQVDVEKGKVSVRDGPPVGGIVTIPGNISSQFISGLLFAGPIMEKGISLRLTSTLESRGYVSLTIETMKKHGVEVHCREEMSVIEVPRNQRYSAAEHEIQGDFSSAAFALSAAAITNSKLIVKGLSDISSEPDASFLEILARMGIEAKHNGGEVSIRGGDLKAAHIDIHDTPDLGPIAAVLGCYAKGQTRISGASRLRYKETDRMAAITTELNSLGARITETPDELIINGPTSLRGGSVRSHGDHRIAMALSIAALGASGGVTIEDSECVSKSYPDFFEDLQSIGVEVVGR